jgi:hypothetical protein
MVLPAFVLPVLAAVVALLLLGGVALLVLLIGYAIYSLTTEKRVSYYQGSYFQGEVTTYMSLAFWSGWSAFLITVQSVVLIASQIIENLFLFFPWLISGFLLASVGLVAIGYQRELTTVTFALYTNGIRPILYSPNAGLFIILNFLIKIFDGVWPFIRLVAEFTRLYLRNFGLFLIQCVGVKLILALLHIGNFISILTLDFGTWISKPGSVIYNELNTTDAWFELLKIEDLIYAVFDCTCAKIDFVWHILFDWLTHPSTAVILGCTVSAAAEVAIQIPVRIFTKTNTGTVPNVTGNYGYFPNFDKVFDDGICVTKNLTVLIDFEIAVIVRELVGEFDTSIFTPGSNASVLLAHEWLSWAGDIACAGVETLRKWVHWGTLAAVLVIQGLVFVFSLIFVSGGYLPDIGPAVYCDIREWRAFFDYGGPASLYFRNGSVFFYLYEAVDDGCALLDLASPYICDVIRPPLLILIDFSNAFGLIAIMIILAIISPELLVVTPFLIPLYFPYAIGRFVIHLVDSEWRMYNPPVPPTGGLPITFWVPAPALPPPPLACPTTKYPGYVLPWLQYYIEDSNGFHKLLITQFLALGSGLDSIFRDAAGAPGVGKFFYGIFALPTYLYDFVVQTVFFLNVILFESTSNRALFLQRWRYAQFLEAIDTFGDGLSELVTELDPNQCTAPIGGHAPNERILCCLGSLLAALVDIFEEIGFTISVIVTTSIVTPFGQFSFGHAIDSLADAIDDLFCAASRIVPPFPVCNTCGPSSTPITLDIAVQDLLQSFTPALVLLFRILDGFIYYAVGFGVRAAANFSTIQAIVTDFQYFFGGFFTLILQDTSFALGSSALVGVGTFIDTVFLSGQPVFYNFFTALVDIFNALSQLVETFALDVLQHVFSVVAAFLLLFFNDNDVGTAILNFLAALGKFILFLVISLPGLLIQLFFGLIAILLPPPLNTIVETIGKLFATGFCYVIQFFSDTVVSIINVFGAGLTVPNFCCDGSAGCVPNVNFKRTVYGPDQQTPASAIIQSWRDNLVQGLQRAIVHRDDLRVRIQHIRRVMELFNVQQQQKRQAAAPPSVLANLTDTTGHTTVPGMLQPLIAIGNNTVAAQNLNASMQSATNNELPVTLDQSVQLIAELVPWAGTSMCDQLVIGLNLSGTTFKQLGLMERLTLQDCVIKRTVGEVFSVLPYFQWFPVDGLYNPTRWLQVGMDAVKDYQIYSQYMSDHQMPRSVVLSSSYIQSWSAQGLRTDHLTADNYLYMMNNMTLQDYVERNNANLALIDGFTGFLQAIQNGLTNQAEYFTNLSQALNDPNSANPLTQWVTGALEQQTGLDPSTQKVQLLWTNMLRLLNTSLTIGTQVYAQTRKRALFSKGWTALTYVPTIVKRSLDGVAWALSATPDPVWEAAKKKRDAFVESSHTLDVSLKRTALGASIAPSGDPAKPFLTPDGVPTSNAIYSFTTSKGAQYGLGRITFNLGESLKQWAYSKIETVRNKLAKANSPRAERNRRIIAHIFSEISAAWSGDDGTKQFPPTIAATVPKTAVQEAAISKDLRLWQQNAQRVREYNAYASAPGRQLPWYPKQRVSTYATGHVTILDNFSFVPELHICDTTLVPFCLGCAILDATFAQAVISTNELVNYYEPGGYYQVSAQNRWNATAEYLAANTTINVCGGDGHQVIHWPSDMVVWPDGSTIFELFGGNKGVAEFFTTTMAIDVPTAGVAWVLDVVSRTGRMDSIPAPLGKNTPMPSTASVKLAGKLIDAGNAVKTKLLPSGISLVRAMDQPLVNVSGNVIYDYASNPGSHKFDLNYAIFQVPGIGPLLIPLTLALDAIGHFLLSASLTFDFQFDPLTNTTVAVPVFDGSGSFGLIGYIWTKLIEANYGYNCNQRSMPLFTGLFLFAFFTLLGYTVLQLTIGIFSGGLVMLIMSLYLLVLPYLFFIVVYNYPVQNLFFLPIPVPPMCFADDAMTTLVCDLLPKCPAVFAPFFKTPYTEENCWQFPFVNGSLVPLSCRDDMNMADMIDVVAALLRWLWPSGPATLDAFFSVIPIIGPPIGSRLGEYATVDLRDKATFDHFVTCMGYVGFWSLGTLMMWAAVAAIILMAGVFIFIVVLGAWFAFLVNIVTLMYYLNVLLLTSTVFFVTPSDIYAFRLAVESEVDRSNYSIPAAVRRRRASVSSASAPVASAASVASQKLTFVGRLFAAAKDKFTEIMSRNHLDYYWKATRGASKEELRALMRSKAKRRREQEALLAREERQRQVEMTDMSQAHELRRRQRLEERVTRIFERM